MSSHGKRQPPSRNNLRVGACRAGEAGFLTEDDTQGCSQSSTAHPAQTEPSRPVPALDGAGAGLDVVTRGRAAAGSGTEHLNHRIRPVSPVLKSPHNVSQIQPPWTRSHLIRQREIFFETRVSGRPEIWGAINFACSLLARGQMLEAQGILDAANILCPTGRVAKGRGRDRVRGGLYDEGGKLYDVPAWVMRDPDDILENEEKEEEEDDGDEELGQEDMLAQQRREEKGKGRAIDGGEELRVRIRFSNGDGDVDVTIRSKQTVGALQALLKDKFEHIGRVKIAYLGKVLEPSKTLESQGWKSGNTLSALVINESDL